MHHRLQRRYSATLAPGPRPKQHEGRPAPDANAILECGWGRLLFGHTFETPEALASALCEEQRGDRDIAFYINDPHVVLAHAPTDLFLDPSHTYRLWFSDYRPPQRSQTRGLTIVNVRTREEIAEINRIYACHGMITVGEDFLAAHTHDRRLSYLIAREDQSRRIVGVVMGVDHRHAFDDPENGSSLWALAVDPQSTVPGVGEALVRRLAERYMARGRAFMDLSVLHNNIQATALYEKLDFRRVPTFTIKRRNVINEKLYSGAELGADYNPYAQIIIDEARRRGIAVEPVDVEGGFFRLIFGGRAILCREALSELTSAVAMSRCDDKTVTRRALAGVGLAVPVQQAAGTAEENAAFLAEHEAVVVKPARGEQGAGVFVDLRTADAVEHAVAEARKLSDHVLLEHYVTGHDLRIIVIGSEVVAAAIRKPAEVVGTGNHTVRELIEVQSRRRAAATGGESRIPMDHETERCAAEAGFTLDDTPAEGRAITVRKTANLHTGGTIHDVTPTLHPRLAEVAVEAARVLEIPVVGFDFIVPAHDGPDYVIIEANERPGLANHEPQPTAAKFIDLLFPQSIGRT